MGRKSTWPSLPASLPVGAPPRHREIEKCASVAPRAAHLPRKHLAHPSRPRTKSRSKCRWADIQLVFVMHSDILITNRDLYLTFPSPVEFNGWFITTSDNDPSKVRDCLNAGSAGLLVLPPRSQEMSEQDDLACACEPAWRPCRMLWFMSSDACVGSGRMWHASITSSPRTTG